MSLDSAEALSASLLERVREVVRTREGWSERLAEDISQRLRWIREEIADEIRGRRVAEMLLDWIEAHPGAATTHQELADLLGTRRETVTRALLALRRSGEIRADQARGRRLRYWTS